MNTKTIATFNPDLPIHMTFPEHDWHLLSQHWYPRHGRENFDIFNPLHNAEIAMRYLAALHRRFGSWERALWYYNCGRVVDVPGGTREYARRIVEAPMPTRERKEEHADNR